ncbi:MULTISPECIES: tyrosine-type recombinase/integrase [Protofrankia]|uniref:Integrase family protein n=1 Tax=Candidatus Protofrankia datiscae TaxID=2716812 RepID=F8B493_9ACTN|nr:MULTISPECIES: tyrosine-type recombinase/integrase [Protofrankia]AEH11010.1 integrase family protein [Candidatus Protofrankia datiscae]
MLTTYNVRIWEIETYKGRRVTTYWVVWLVDGKKFKEPYRNKAQAVSFRADLLSAARKGEAFFVVTGLPVSMARVDGNRSWYDFACDYADLKWPQVAATTRRTHAEALTALTVLMLSSERGRPDPALLRRALKLWAFNTTRRADAPDDVRAALSWAAAHTRPVSTLSDEAVLRKVIAGLTVCLDGTPRAPSVVTRWRKILNNAVEYAISLKLLTVNPLPALRKATPRSTQIPVIDRRAVANPVQARTLLKAVADDRPSGPRLVAFFGCLYFAALRPEEAAALTKANLSLPSTGWGELFLDTARPYAGREWTDSGEARDARQLKQRARGEVRQVPCPPELTELLHTHLDQFGTGPDGRLFVGARNHGHLPPLTVTRVWARARTATFTETVASSPLARTPYDLRHAAVSTWLNAGVPPTTVAAWAGHSVDVLLTIYAKCVDGEAAVMRSRIDDALGRPAGPDVSGITRPQTPPDDQAPERP